MDNFSGCGLPQENLHTVEEKLTFLEEKLTFLEENLTFQGDQSLETRMDKGFPACGYLLQRYLQRYYEEIYKFAHTRKRACTHTHAKKHINAKSVKPTIQLNMGC